jgi:hypothetical protein
MLTALLHWLAIIWHYLSLVFLVAGGLWAILELPSAIRRHYRQSQDRRALHSQLSAANRLKKLESELVKLSQMPVIEQHQAKFYIFILFSVGTSSIGLTAWASSIYFPQHTHPSPWMALAVVVFLFSAIVSMAGMHHFQILLETVRTARKREIEDGIIQMTDKLAKFTEQER